MPLFDYACQKCEHEFEALTRSGDEVKCPKCESKKVQKRLGVPAKPQVKGSTSSLPTACMSEGPPCGPVCSRFKNN